MQHPAISRRVLTRLAGGVLGAVLLLGAAPLAMAPPAMAQDKPAKLVVMSHAVHRNVATTGPGGDVTEAWRKQQGIDVEWLTFAVEAVNERVFREASLAQGNVDVAFILDRYGGPQIAHMFEDLEEWQKRDPIADFDEISPGMRLAHTHRGKLIGIPYRHATHGFFYNETFLKERGVEPPKTFKDMVAAAERLTYMRDGTRVHGFVLSMDDPSAVMDWIRAYGGEFITSDYKVVVDQPAAVQAVTALRDLWRKEVFPRNMMTFKTEEVITFMQQGRAAMTNQPFGRFVNYNNPTQSKFPGQIPTTPLPVGLDGKPVAAKTSVWAMAIPKNARNKALSWSLIKHLSSTQSTIAAALNGNGPVRKSAYADAKVRALVPYADAEVAALADARLTVPGFDSSAKAMDIMMEELQAAMLGMKGPEQAMADVKKRVEPLLPK